MQPSALVNWRYRLWHVSDKEIPFVCGRVIWQGHAFCTLKNCSKNHQQDRVCTLLPGEAYVKQSCDSAFKSLESELAISRKNASQSFDEWVTMFNLVQESDDFPPSSQKRVCGVTLEELEERAKKQSKLLAFKTPKPKRRKQNAEEEVNLLEFKSMF